MCLGACRLTTRSCFVGQSGHQGALVVGMALPAVVCPHGLEPCATWAAAGLGLIHLVDTSFALARAVATAPVAPPHARTHSRGHCPQRPQRHLPCRRGRLLSLSDRRRALGHDLDAGRHHHRCGGHHPGQPRIFLVFALPTMLSSLALAWALTRWRRPAVGSAWRWPPFLLAYLGILISLAKGAYGSLQRSIAADQAMATEPRLAPGTEPGGRSHAAKTRFLASASHDLRQPLHT